MYPIIPAKRKGGSWLEGTVGVVKFLLWSVTVRRPYRKVNLYRHSKNFR